MKWPLGLVLMESCARSEANALPSLFVAPKVSPIEVQTTTTTDTVPDKQPVDLDANLEGFYSDGVYIARTGASAPGKTTLLTDDSEGSHAQSAYYNLLRHRFILLRSTLKCTPPASAVAALSDDHLISLPRRSREASREWRRLILTRDPKMVQLACMDMDSVLGALEITARVLSDNLRTGGLVMIKRLGAWAWGLLGRCRDVGQLGPEEVGEIRLMAKRAVAILKKLKQAEKRLSLVTLGEGDSQLEIEDGEVDEAGDDAVHDVADRAVERDAGSSEPIARDDIMPDAGPEDHTKSVSDHGIYELTPAGPDSTAEPISSLDELQAAKARLQAKLADDQNFESAIKEEDSLPAQSLAESRDDEIAEIRGQTRAMLDMIITVVGEFYGQRDLLESREVWEQGTV